MRLIFFFFNDTATTEIYTLSLHDALPISCRRQCATRRSFETWLDRLSAPLPHRTANEPALSVELDRKSTRLNSSHQIISYAVFCLKKKKLAYYGPNRTGTVRLVR